uniref:hypothetical protein n=1 Tax=Mycobacterium tuberculosis TaxID=1773 RepID=UPI00254B0451
MDDGEPGSLVGGLDDPVRVVVSSTVAPGGAVLALLALHLVLALTAPAAARVLDRRVFLLAAVAPAA